MIARSKARYEKEHCKLSADKQNKLNKKGSQTCQTLTCLILEVGISLLVLAVFVC
jgi:hypothetical protein